MIDEFENREVEILVDARLVELLEGFGLDCGGVVEDYFICVLSAGFGLGGFVGQRL